MSGARLVSAVSAVSTLIGASAVALASYGALGCSSPKCAPAAADVAVAAPGGKPPAVAEPDGGAASGSAPSAEDMSKVAATLERFHLAAAAADEEAYFGLFADGGVFMGTDAKERWTVPQFRAYAHPRFASGKAWSFRSVSREIAVHGDTAWFDESLDTPNLGPARGSGVLVRDGKGDWKVAQYNLSVPIPNERFAEVKTVIERGSGGTATPPSMTPSGNAEPAICLIARRARSRGSPAAAGLEAQCRAAGGAP